LAGTSSEESIINEKTVKDDPQNSSWQMPVSKNKVYGGTGQVAFTGNPAGCRLKTSWKSDGLPP
jgi:hypothetical protein